MKTQKTDTRTVKQVEKSVIAMRRRVAAAVRKHNKLQERIARLEVEGRIVNLNHDYEVLTGIDCWYVKSDSLNTNPDSLTNYYYETTYNERNGYGCSCESLSPQGCKHIRQLGQTFAPVEPESNEDLQAYKQRRESQYQGVLNNANRGFSLLRV